MQYLVKLPSAHPPGSPSPPVRQVASLPQVPSFWFESDPSHQGSTNEYDALTTYEPEPYHIYGTRRKAEIKETNMKLWIQSSANMGVDPAWSDYERALKSHLHNVARADTTISLKGTNIFSPGVNYYWYDRHLHASQIIEAAIQAEREGYDAFVQTGMLDYGYFEIKEAISIPAIFPIETALHVATLLAPRFAFFAMNPAFLEHLTQKAKSYGFEGRMVPGSFVEIHYQELGHAFKNPQPLVERLAIEAKRLGEMGANILVFAGNPVAMLLISNGIKEIGGVRILDSIGILVKMAEMMVELNRMGMGRNQMGIYSPIPQRDLSRTREIYGLEK